MQHGMPSCEAELNAYCNSHCHHSKAHGQLYARFDIAHRVSEPAWRCYARLTLSPDLLKYRQGIEYCTRHRQLLHVLNNCLNAAAATGAPAKLISSTHVAPKDSYVTQTCAHMGDGSQSSASDAASTLASVRPTRDTLACCRTPRYRRAATPAPHYEHDENFLKLPSSLHIPKLSDCEEQLVEDALFWVISLYTTPYASKASRLVASCKRWSVCCVASLMSDSALHSDGSQEQRYRLIATKPLFIYRSLQQSPIPLVWMDADLEFHAFPTLFTRAGWAETDGPLDAILWNWQANVSHFAGRRLKMASGVAWFNVTEPARALVVAWAEAMAYGSNIHAPDDQTMDLLVNNDGWMDRASFGWLPESYLRMMPRHSHVEPVIDHDRGAPVSGRGRNSPIVPILPPHRWE